MIDVKEAVNSAQEYLSDLYQAEGVARVLLEEVELSEDRLFWFVTLSFTLPGKSDGTLGGALKALGHGRDYKIFKVDADTGEVVSMKISAA